MPEGVAPTRGRARRPAALAIVLLLATLGAGGAPGEDALFRQVKIDVFDKNWTEVLRGCDELLARFPASPSASQVAFYRARALAHLPGREVDALTAFRRFVARHPEDRVLAEEAWAAIFALACDPKSGAKTECVPILREGLASSSSYVSTLAAIRASDREDDALRRKALVTLKRAYETQTDPDIANEILIAILKIDPKQVPQPRSPKPPAVAARPGDSKQPTLIRMTVFNKAEGRFEVKVNLPVAFARALIDALGEDEKEEITRQARAKGVNLDDIFEAIRKSGAGKLLDVDTAESHVEIWIE